MAVLTGVRTDVAEADSLPISQSKAAHKQLVRSWVYLRLVPESVQGS